MKIKEGGVMDIQKSIEHVLKTDPAVFQDVLDGKKTFEIRFNDRGYQVGDLVVLKETKFTGQQMKSGEPLVYTGREIQKRISYVLSGYGLHEGWVILAIQDIKATKTQAVPEGFALVSQKDLLELTIAINAVDLATHTESKTNEVREMWQDIALKLMVLGGSQS